MGLFDWMKKKPKGTDEATPPTAQHPDPSAMPWDQGPSIYGCLSRYSKQDLQDQNKPALPDEDRVNAEGRVRFAAGAMDGIATYHMGPGSEDEQMEQIARLIADYCESPTAQHKLAVYRWVLEHNVLSLLDPLLDRLGSLEVNGHRLYDLAYALATEAPDREPVKLAIAILGRFNRPENIPLFMTLGRHDEFALYSAVAIGNQSEEPERDLLALAKQVHGWGRIQIVERLCETQDPDIQDWLIREGFRNSIMHEYLAYPCAMGGELHHALARPALDSALAISAGEIIQALINGGPAADISHYEHGRQALGDYLRHAAEGEYGLEVLSTVLAIRRYLEALHERETRSEFEQWDEDDRAEALRRSESIIKQPTWGDPITQGLQSQDSLQFSMASRAAEALGIETWDAHWDRLRQNPQDPGCWFNIMKAADENTISQVVTHAQQVIPLEKIATGIGDELGLGPDFVDHSCLDFVLQDLRRFPGHGLELIRAGLNSPVVRNRNMALMALKEWQDGDWPEEIMAQMREIESRDPNEKTRELSAELLQRI